MFIEVLGLPGAGKSSIIKGVVPPLRQSGFKIRTGKTIAALPAAGAGLPRYISAQPDRTLLYRAMTFANEFPALTAHLDRHLKLSSTERFLYALTTTYRQAFEEYRHKVDFALVDEGLIHRGADAHRDITDPLVYMDYLNIIPVPDAVIYMKVDARMALRRSIERRSERRASKARVEAKLGGVEAYDMRRTLIEIGVKRAQERGAQVIEVDATKPLQDCADMVMSVLRDTKPKSGSLSA